MYESIGKHLARRGTKALQAPEWPVDMFSMFKINLCYLFLSLRSLRTSGLRCLKGLKYLRGLKRYIRQSLTVGLGFWALFEAETSGHDLKSLGRYLLRSSRAVQVLLMHAR